MSHYSLALRVIGGVVIIIGSFIIHTLYNNIRYNDGRQDFTQYVAAQQISINWTQAQKDAQETLQAADTLDYDTAEHSLTTLIQHIAEADTAATIYVTTLEGKGIILITIIHSLMQSTQDLESIRLQLQADIPLTPEQHLFLVHIHDDLQLFTTILPQTMLIAPPTDEDISRIEDTLDLQIQNPYGDVLVNN